MRIELVTTLKRKATEIISSLDQDRNPVLITQYGKPVAYLVDVETFERLQKRTSILEGLLQGEEAIADGQIVAHATAKKRLARWMNG